MLSRLDLASDESIIRCMIDENISRRRTEAPLALPCEESMSDREHVKVVETCAINGG